MPAARRPSKYLLRMLPLTSGSKIDCESNNSSASKSGGNGTIGSGVKGTTGNGSSTSSNSSSTSSNGGSRNRNGSGSSKTSSGGSRNHNGSGSSNKTSNDGSRRRSINPCIIQRRYISRPCITQRRYTNHRCTTHHLTTSLSKIGRRSRCRGFGVHDAVNFAPWADDPLTLFLVDRSREPDTEVNDEAYSRS